MSAPESADLAAFERMLQRIPAGAVFSIDLIRDDLRAAQIKPSSYGSLFKSAVHRDWLIPVGADTTRAASRRNGVVRLYRKAVA